MIGRVRKALPHVIAAALVVAVAVLVVGWAVALASDRHEAWVCVWGDLPPMRWFLFVGRSSCGFGRVQTADYSTVAVPVADRRLLGFQSTVGDVVTTSVTLPQNRAGVTGPHHRGPPGGYANAFHVVQLGVPVLLAVPMLAWFPAVHWQRTLRLRRRRRLGLCLACGYDLQASTTGVCPECGGVA
jgi:hypothetical protein